MIKSVIWRTKQTKYHFGITEKDGLERKEIKGQYEGYCNNSDT